MGNFTELKHDQRYRPDVHNFTISKTCECVVHCLGLLRRCGRDGVGKIWLLTSRDVHVGADFIPKDGGFFPKLRQQLAQLRSDYSTIELVRDDSRNL